MVKYDKFIYASTLVIMLVLFSMSAFAASSDFTINVTPIKDDIYEDDAGIYELVITNNAGFTDYFEKPGTYQSDWITYTNEVMVVPAYSTRKFNLSLDPKTNVFPAQYEVKFYVSSSITKDFVDESVFINIRPLNQVFPGYKASIALSVEVPYEIDPRNEIPITIYLRNRNALNVEDMRIQISSNLLNDEYSIPLLPLEEKTTQLRYNLDSYQVPFDDTLNVKIIIHNLTINQRSIPIKIMPYTSLVDKITIKKSFLKKVFIINLTNEGNVLNEESYNVPVGYFENLFTSTSPSSIKVSNGEISRAFNLNLNPQESRIITVEVNYRIILYLSLLIIFSVLGYYKFRSPIVIKKRIIPIHGDGEGVNEFHVRMLVMNRTKQPVENISIVEIVPRIVAVIKETHIGTLEPSKVINHDKKGTLLKWDINYLEPFEERIITFKILSKLGIVGSLVLGKTKAKYETSNGHHRVTHSSKESVKI